MDLKAEVYQFLSRPNIPDLSLGSWNTYPAQRPDIKITINYEIRQKPFEVNFAHVITNQPSIGAHQYIDPYVDKYMSKRWPKCIYGIATINSSSPDILQTDILKNILLFLRKHLWARKNKQEYEEFIRNIIDQTSTTLGYRREYFDRQHFDISGNRRPSSSKNFVETEIGEYVGPGVAHLTNIDAFDNVNELVWSWIIPFKDRKGLRSDLPQLQAKITSIRKHFNSYDELEDAARLLGLEEIKACIRSAASAVDAILRFYCNAWDMKFPKSNIPFDEKIEVILAKAGKPPYKASDAENLRKLLYLYRAISSMHEGDCYYKDDADNTVYVTNLSKAEELVKAAEAFTIWIDAIV